MVAGDPFDLVGNIIEGRYRVDGVVGEGGFGVVYRGWHLSFEHDIAIKCLKTPSHFTEEGQRTFVAKFREEGKLLSRLSQHPAVVRVYDFGTTQCGRGASVPYLVLEWLVGEPLDSWLARRTALHSTSAKPSRCCALRSKDSRSRIQRASRTAM